METGNITAFILGMVLMIFFFVVLKGMSLILSGNEDLWNKYFCNRI